MDNCMCDTRTQYTIIYTRYSLCKSYNDSISNTLQLAVCQTHIQLEINVHRLPKAMQYRQGPWAIFFTKLGAGRVSQVRSLTPDFTVEGLKMWPTGDEIAKIGIFWYKFSPKGYIPLSDFYKIWRGGVTPRPAPSCQI